MAVILRSGQKSDRSALALNSEQIETLLSARGSRERVSALAKWIERDSKSHFNIRWEKLPEFAKKVIQHLEKNDPKGVFGFETDSLTFGFETKSKQNSAETDPMVVARSQIDWIFLKTLLSGNPGERWKWKNPQSQKTLVGTEGLTSAAFDLFRQGLFSFEPVRFPLRLEAQGLVSLGQRDFERVFQVNSENPLLALTGRLTAIRSLGSSLEKSKEVFGTGGGLIRPCGLIDFGLNHWLPKPPSEKLTSLTVLFSFLTKHLAPIIPGKLTTQSRAQLGDSWVHPLFAVEDPQRLQGIIPFHSFFHSLSWNLVPTMNQAGVKFESEGFSFGCSDLLTIKTILNLGLVTFKTHAIPTKNFLISDPEIIELRALSRVLLEKTAEIVRKHFSKRESQIPLITIAQNAILAGEQIIKEAGSNLPSETISFFKSIENIGDGMFV